MALGETRARELGAPRDRAVRLLAVLRQEKLLQVGALQPSAPQVRADQRSPAQIGAREIRLMQVGAVEPGVAQVTAAQAEGALAGSHIPVDRQVRVGDIEVALKETEKRAVGGREDAKVWHGVPQQLGSPFRVRLAQRRVHRLAWDGGDAERDAHGQVAFSRNLRQCVGPIHLAEGIDGDDDPDPGLGDPDPLPAERRGAAPHLLEHPPEARAQGSAPSVVAVRSRDAEDEPTSTIATSRAGQTACASTPSRAW